MRAITITTHLFEKDDRVWTYDGWGTVTEDEAAPFSRRDLCTSEIKVKLDGNPDSRLKDVVRTFEASLVTPAAHFQEPDPKRTTP
jgi:hypothetical protein